MRIIALQGRANSGKTTTINLLDGMLRNANYVPVPGTRRDMDSDFLEVFTSPLKIKVGVTSCGDTHDAVEGCLRELISQGCAICVCACRTYDRIPPGTVAATQSFPSHPATYISKTVSPTPAAEATDNALDANRIFQAI